ncbi:hypothetical protein [Novosphingobium sp.]|uniref:hypothetical protein n=1 Tax=Novosphingobium sp. TaxID=1874826 RepID=UPI00286D3D25|nr:hypothetical protein [Novosphingobium sp.]
MSFRPAPAAILICALSLGACAQDTSEFPSLAKRPAERVTATYGTPPAPAVQVPLPQPSAQVLGAVDSLVAKAQQADARFRRGEATARRLVGQSGRARVGSEPWAVATMAVSELEAARGQAMVPLAELDRMFAEAMTRGEDVTRVADARDRVIGIIARQDQTLIGLLRQLDN